MYLSSSFCTNSTKVLFGVTAMNKVFALDAATGKLKWEYIKTP
ncbi:hypothetical protein [Pedobacter sp.]